MTSDDDAFNKLLADSEFVAFRWETPPVTVSTNERPFEFVLLNAPALVRRADPSDFQEYFCTDPDVVAFGNRGGDAQLVVPCPCGPSERDGHLAAFVRQAPPAQQDELWRLVAESMAAGISAQPVWLSTAGMGVPWLHVRLDSSPKYYGQQPYQTELAHR